VHVCKTEDIRIFSEEQPVDEGQGQGQPEQPVETPAPAATPSPVTSQRTNSRHQPEQPAPVDGDYDPFEDIPFPDIEPFSSPFEDRPEQSAMYSLPHDETVVTRTVDGLTEYIF
jgi:hypothetical protein